MPTAPPKHGVPSRAAPAKDDRPSSHARGYGRRWQKARDGFVRSHPLCARCLEQNELTPTAVVDHIVPHRGDMALFWDRSNWQGLCKTHHDAKTAAEDGGFGNAPRPRERST